ncbi:MAG: hypothetical protein FJ349_06910 [Sphingomonadales bacterium]|nr:hypothetical protein [Sphingomonadales bacterium]
MNLLLSKTNNLINSTMIKPHFLFFIATFLIALNSWSQDRVLQVENKETGEKVLIKPDTKVVLTTINNKYKGNLILPSDSLIKIDDNAFVLEDIDGIYIPNEQNTKKGVSLIVVGSLGVVAGYGIVIVAALSSFWGTVTNNSIGSANANPIYALELWQRARHRLFQGLLYWQNAKNIRK